MTYWGYHLMLDCSNCDKDAIKSKEDIGAFVRHLVQKIDMIAFGEPMIEHFATHDPDKAGISFCQMIETSNISGHFVDLNGAAYIDVFSCKPFNNQDVIDTINVFFNPEKVRMNFVTRNAD